MNDSETASAPQASAHLGERAEALRQRLEASAAEMLQRGVLALAASIRVPTLDEPLRVSVGSIDMSGSAPLRGDERFPIASQSKVFTAAAVLLLAQEKLLDLDDPVSRYVGVVPAVDEDATIRQFLNHTSGIGNFIHTMTTLPWPWPTFAYEDLLALARMQGRQHRAGAAFAYNNTDVVVLARVCEIVTGRPLAEFLQERIFGPLGMLDTCVAMEDGWNRDRMASGYYVPGGGYEGEPVDVSRLFDYSIGGAAANIVSSLPDQMKWACELLSNDPATGLKLDDFAADLAHAGVDYPHWFFPPACGRSMERWMWAGRHFWGHRGSFYGYHSGTFLEPASGAAFSMFLTMCTRGSFMQFIDRQAHDYMVFLGGCAHAALDLAELP